MKGLYNFILENLDVELKQQLLDIINSPSLTNKVAKKMIRAAVEDPEVLVNRFKDYFTERGCEDDITNIVRILDANNNIEEMLSIIDDKSILPTAIDFIKNDNIYSLFKQTNIDIKTLKELANEFPSKNSITRGRFEILCQLLLQDVNLANKNYPGKAGDVNAGGLALEFKGPGARVKGQKECPATLIDDMFAKLTGVNEAKVFATQANMKKVFSHEFFSNKTDEEIFEIICKSLYAQYNKGTDSDIQLLKPIQKDVVNRGKIIPNNITKLMGCIQLQGYQNQENWDYICIFTGKKGDEALQKGNYVCLTADYCNDIVKTFNDSKLTFTAGGNGHGAVRDHYCQIFCK